MLLSSSRTFRFFVGTVRLPRQELAGKAFEAFLASLSDPKSMGAEYTVGTELVIPESVARIRNS